MTLAPDPWPVSAGVNGEGGVAFGSFDDMSEGVVFCVLFAVRWFATFGDELN